MTRQTPPALTKKKGSFPPRETVILMTNLPTKITQISKDFDIKSKDIIEIFKELGIEKKSGGSVDNDEFELFLAYLTSKRQIKDLAAYREGRSRIKSSVAKKPKAEESKPLEAVKPKETPAAKPQETPAAKADAPKAAPAKPASPAKPAAQPERKPQPNAQAGGNRPERDRRENNRADRPRDDRPRDDRRGQSYGKYSAAPQENPFAKKHDNMNRAAQGLRASGSQRPEGKREEQKKPQQQPQQQPQQKVDAQAPQRVEPAKAAAVLPAQKAQLEKQQRIEAQKSAAPAPQPQPKKKEEKKAQKQQFKTITPTVDRSSVRGGVNIGGEYSSNNAPKTRVVDTRTTDVNLSKYDDRYNDQYYAILNGGDSKAQKQKLKKQDNRGQNQKSAKDKERAAQEKIKRMEAERARSKQLEITVPDEITVSELASRMKKTAAEVIKKLMFMGEMKGLNDVIDYATAELIADEFGVKVTKEVVVTIEEKLFTEAEDNEEDLVERAPVVCVMGHVDHGKTSILDAIRHTNVTRGEAGGITQAIGAYRVKANGKDITFLDTPGHEAFTAMRMRGAKSTDIAILVVAADDGVMPQTIEAINHAKAAGIDIIVAINKMDKPTANPDNVLNQLTQYELVPEAWGGDVITVPVSAHTGMGIEDLLENVLLVAEVKELRANPKRRAAGLVIESKLDRGRGPVATVLVQNGTLHQGDYVIVGNAVGRVRAMVDDKGKTVKTAGPSVPVEIIGLDDVPQAGDELNAVEDERMAKNLAEQRREKLRQEILTANARVNLDELFGQIAAGIKTLNIVVKADVAGSVEAVKASLLKLSNEEVKVTVIHAAVGGITETDVMLAAASNAIICGFNVRPDRNALDSAERNKVDIRCHRIIYEIIDEIEAAMKGLLAPVYKEVLLGHAEVRQTIKVPGVGIIAGCYILDGKIIRSAQIRIVRDGIVIFEDKISSLRRFKDDVREVNAGYECGVGIEKFNDIRTGDTLEAFIMEEVER